MRLGLCLFRHNYFPNGHIFKGRERLVRRVEPMHLKKLEYKLKVEEHNMLLLRNPYLTLKEEDGHIQAMDQKNQCFFKMIDRHRASFKRKNVYAMDILGSLNSTKSWD